MNMAAAAGGGELMNAAAQQYAHLGAKGSTEWLGSKMPGLRIEPPAIPAAPPTFAGAPPPLRTPTKAAKGVQKAETAYADVRSQLPTVPPEELKAGTAEAGQRALTGAYQTREGLRESARLAAKGKYSDYEKALTHPNNVAPPGLQLKEGVFEPDAQGNLVMKKPPVLTTTPFNSPVETAPFRTELEQLIEHDARSPFPAGHPIRKFLDAMGPAKGYDYIQFDDLKKALGKLSVYADPKGGLRDPYQGMARQIIEKAHPILMDKLKDIARESNVPIK